MSFCALVPVDGTTTQIASTKDFVYPTAFSAPKIFHINTTPFVIPICPTKFTSKAVGWTMALSSTMANNLVSLQGTCTYVEPDSSSQNGVYGEKTGPIHTKDINSSSTGDALLSPNAASIPSFETTATPFYLFAKLGKPYIMHLKVGSESVEATMVCTLP